MLPTRRGSIRLFRVVGIDVFIDWSWFIVAVLLIQMRSERYTSIVWNILEYLALFVLVLLHEFGHALACRQTGGQANQIVLWPLGGIAYVAPPQRPGAVLWSILAGPLVNLALAPVLMLLVQWSVNSGFAAANDNIHGVLEGIWIINIVLLVFNLLPIYPLDGGQILRALLWFPLGRAKSLYIATIVGFAGVVVLGLFAFYMQSIWIGIMTAFVLMNCVQGWKQAKLLAQIDAIPRRKKFACPVCKSSPPVGNAWLCGRCNGPFDTFVTDGLCPHCGEKVTSTTCPDCGASKPLPEWNR